MADFCKQCSIDIWGEDFGDFKRLTKSDPPLEEGEGWVELCEGCGPTIVNDDGECIHPHCSIHGVKYE